MDDDIYNILFPSPGFFPINERNKEKRGTSGGKTLRSLYLVLSIFLGRIVVSA